MFSDDNLDNLFKTLNTNESGLTNLQAQERIKKYGKNKLPEKKVNKIKILLSQFLNPLILILITACILMITIPFFEKGEIHFEEFLDPIVIVLILIINATIGFIQEIKAEKTIENLKKLRSENTTVLRDNKKQIINSEDTIVGDICYINEGDKISADMRIIKSNDLTITESSITGESNPIKKDPNWIGEGITSEQKNMIFSGTSVISGNAKAVVCAIGEKTELGKISKLVKDVKKPKTPLEKNLSKLSKKISIVILLICILVFFLAFLRGSSYFDSFFISVALAVGAIPEGLPAIMTISLALGIKIMSNKNVLVRNLKSVETLGNINIVATDKTGTITENKMKVTDIFFENKIIDSEEFNKFSENKKFIQLLSVMKNCNNAELPNIGDPTELALLEFAEKFSVQKLEKTSEIPFSSEKKYMSTIYEDKNAKNFFDFYKELTLSKGAPEIIMQKFPDQQKNIMNASEEMANKGLRVIAISACYDNSKNIFLGLVGLQDPPRKSVKDSIKKAKEAGIRTVMITGDYHKTALSIAKQIGLIKKDETSNYLLGAEIIRMSEADLRKKVRDVSIFSRVTPECKLRICKALQKEGFLVAMTGDGVNDAPAIKRAEVGISMGKNGTSVARETSDIVILDDSFSSIIDGIEEGRKIFTNIQKAILFLLKTNFIEVFLILIVMLLGFQYLPLLPIHILFLNLLTDSFPALALVAEPSEKNIMQKSPRSKNYGFLKNKILQIFILGGAGAIISLSAFIFAINNMSAIQAQTFVLTTIVFMEVAVIFSIRSNAILFQNNFELKNKWILKSVILVLLIFFIALFTPLNSFLKIEPFPVEYWSFPIFSAILFFTIAELIKVFNEIKNSIYAK